MKYISIDIETTGLNPNLHKIIEIGAYVEDTNNILPRENLPSFQAFLWYENYIGTAYALQMNANMFRKIVELKNTNDSLLFDSEWKVVNALKQFINTNFGSRPAVFAGKNVGGFDLQFLKRLYTFDKEIKYSHRILDPSMYYVDWKSDSVPPDMKACKHRCGLSENVSHEALDDAWDVIQLLRFKYPISEAKI